MSVGIHDATISDFASPEAGRTKKILSALINFAKFREERLVAYTEYTQQSVRISEVKRAGCQIIFFDSCRSK